MSYAKPANGNVNYSRVLVPLTALALTAGCASKGYVNTRVEDLGKRTTAVEQSVGTLEKRTEAVESRVSTVESRVGTLEETTDNLAHQPIVEGPISVTRRDYPREFERLVRAVISQYENRDSKSLIWHAYMEGKLIIELAPHLNGETYSATSNLDYNGNGVAGRGDRTVMDKRSDGQTYGSVTLLGSEIPRRMREEKLPMIEPSSRRRR